MRVCSVVSNSATPWTIYSHQTPLSVVFSRQEYRSGLPLPNPGDSSDPRSKPMSLVSPALAGWIFTTAPPGKPSDNAGTGQHSDEYS